MKVLVIGSRVPYPLHDGGAIATYNMLKGLSEAGVEVSFICINTKKHFVDEETIAREFSFLSSIRSFFIDTDVKAIPALINIFSSNSYNIERFYNVQFADILKKEINKKQFDLIHFEGLFVAKYVKTIKGITRIPLLLRQHNIEFRIWERLAKATIFPPKKMYLYLLAKRMKKFEQIIIHEFDTIACITENDTLEIMKMDYQGGTVTIPAGIEIKPNDFAPTIDPFTIYHIGSMEWMPNQQAMEWFHNDIWPLVTAKESKAMFYMAGKNMPEKYQGWNTDTFRVKGQVDNLQAFTADKSILVVPLKSGSGIRIKTIEAMLAGKAVVTTSQGAHGLPVVHGEHCLIADTAEEFTEAILKLLADKNLRDRLAENGKTFALEHFSNKAVSKQWLEYYEGLKDN